MPRKKLFRNETPGVGKILFDHGVKRENKTKEIAIAKWMIGRYGGNYRILDESKEEEVKTPDACRNGIELLEFKTPSTINALGNRLREAVTQLLYKNNHIAKVSGKYIVIVATGDLAKESRGNLITETRNRLKGMPSTEITAVIMKAGNRVMEIRKF